MLTQCTLQSGIFFRKFIKVTPNNAPRDLPTALSEVYPVPSSITLSSTSVTTESTPDAMFYLKEKNNFT